MTRWNNTSYQKINNAKFINNQVIVSFENGDEIKIPIENLTLFGFTDIEWTKLSFNPFEIIIPANPHSLEIPWDNLRVITDKEFAKYLAEKSEEQSKLIGVKVKRLREKKGINSKELAERAGIAPQTISRIEQGHTDVSFATLRKILAAMGYSLKDLADQEKEIELEMESTQRSFNILLKKLSYVGINTNLLTNKIIPKSLLEALNTQKSNGPSLWLDEAVSYVSTIYNWSPEEIWNKTNLTIKSEPAAMAFFKKPTNANESQVKAYSHYAYYMAKVVLKAVPVISKDNWPESIEEFKEQYFKKSERIELKNLLEFVWDLGVCVLPLNDSGVFHGASWNIEGRHVIVLKQNTLSHAKWIFDLLHEMYHVFYHLDENNTAVIEVDELNPFSKNEAEEEREANTFANQVIFGDSAEELAEQCIKVAHGDITKLSIAVRQVAKEEKIGEDFLSNYLAYRLGVQNQNWWSSANRMQITNPNPFNMACEVLKNKIQIKKLSPMDLNLLNTAITF